MQTTLNGVVSPNAESGGQEKSWDQPGGLENASQRSDIQLKVSSSGSPCGCPATGPSHPPLAGSETGRSASFSVTVFLSRVCSPLPPFPFPPALPEPSTHVGLLLSKAGP